MKQKISISIDEEKIKLVEKLLQDGKFRSKSHVIEYSIDRFLKENDGGMK
jgi:Arc/MetJ-type ribon-helix-helix transcriptional regulator